MPGGRIGAIRWSDQRDDALFRLAEAGEGGPQQLQFADAIGRKQQFAERAIRPAASRTQAIRSVVPTQA
jgi:hypothetical protein